MTTPATQQDMLDHFAHCLQVLGGVTASSRRLGIDERALRRFASGEKPISERLLADTAQALREMMAQARVAEQHIVVKFGITPDAE
jgi:hypothetical protein